MQESDLKRLHEDAIKKDPFISQALGPKAKVERMKAAALRLGGQGLSTTFDEHLLIIGDAAGHIDPFTGEGIHTAMMVTSLPSPENGGLRGAFCIMHSKQVAHAYLPAASCCRKGSGLDMANGWLQRVRDAALC